MWQFLAVGIISGILSGSLGAGGGVIMVPLLLLCGMTIQESITVGLAITTVPSGAPGLYLQYKAGNFKVKESIIVTFGVLIGIIIGSYVIIEYNLSQKTLTRALSILMMFLSIYIGFRYG
jgi:hypothetical protein